MKGAWEARARRLGEIIPRGRLHPAVVAWADGRPAGERWAVAFSGGADSLCLLLLLRAHWPRRKLCALHFNHRLRGAAASADAAFCRRVCRSLGISFAAGAWAGPRARGEAAAREARFAFFGREMTARRLGALWLGHQQDDVAETVLMRLSRGSGTAGLAAPRPIQKVERTVLSTLATPPELMSSKRPGARPLHLLVRTRVRPLLTLKKAEITDALKRAGAPWREDATNRGPAYFRNRIRRDVLKPWIRASGRDALAGAGLSRELLEEDDQALESWTRTACRVTPAGRLDLRRLAGLPRAVTRRALHRWLLAQPSGCVLSRQGFEGLLGAVERRRPTRQSLGTRGFAKIDGKWLAFVPVRARS